MREIKFRAWDRIRKEWAYFTLNEIISNIYENPELLKN